MRNINLFLVTFILVTGCSGSNESALQENDLKDLSWEEIGQKASGQQVTMMMWQGDPFINDYMQKYVIPEVKEMYGVDLQIVSGQGSQVVSTVMAELEAGKDKSEIDIAWINGETFYQLRQINALFGPFTQKLPNAEYINFRNPFIGMDFQQPVEGYECPWGNVQLALIYNKEKVQQPPQTLAELEEWVKENPGKFTIGNDFTGMTLLKSWMTAIAGGRGALDGPFSEEKYAMYSDSLFSFIEALQPYFWNNGETFPASVAQMHQLFANGELWFTMSNNDGEVDNKLAQGLFPKNSRAYVPASGTIQNSHYLGILRLAPHKPGAMAVINFLISPEAQYQKMQPQVWGDGTVLDVEELPLEWQEKFRNIPGRKYAPSRADIQPLALQEPAPEYMIRLYNDFRSRIIEGN